MNGELMRFIPMLSLSLILVACGGQSTNASKAEGGNAAPPPGNSVQSPAPNTVNFPGLRKDYVISKNENQYLVTPRSEVGSAMSVPVDAILQFTDKRVNLGIAAKANSISAAQLDSLIELYVAFFNRVPESDGLSYWIDDLKGGSSLVKIADNFYFAAQQYPAQTGYSSSMTSAEFVKIIYKNVLGRSGDTAPTEEEIRYWSSQIDDGRMTRGRAVLVMLDAAHQYANDPKWSWMVNLLNNKISVSRTFAVTQGLSFNTPEENITKTIDIASRITWDSTTAAVNQIGISDAKLNLIGRSTPDDLKGICTPEAKKSWVRTHLDDVYLWYKEIVDTNRQSYSNSNDYFSSLLVPTRDRFSYASDAQQSSGYFEEGVETGYGARWVWSGSQLRVRYVHGGSPADVAGIKRGDTLVAMDGAAVNGSLSESQFNGLFYPKAGDSHTFQMLSGSTQVLTTKTILANRFSLTPVLQRQIISSGGKKVGYLVFTDHIQSAELPLIEAITYFKSNGIDELVLDLRYNGGGYIYIANYLASMLGGTKVNGKVFEKLVFNDKYPEFTNGYIEVFSTLDSSNFNLPKLSLSRVFVITSSSTCSASESIINGLTPFMSVIRIGQSTCGKPYGMIGKTNCDVSHFALQFSGVNSLGSGDFTSGFSPQCLVSDDLNHALGDLTESRLATSLNYIQTGTCGALASSTMKSVPSLQEREVNTYPWRMNKFVRQ